MVDDFLTRDGTRGRPPPLELALPNRYEDRGVLGTGGEGEVRQVYDRVLRRVVAMKLHHGDGGREEMLLAASLQHPAIVAVLDAGVAADGRRWFTMPKVHGVRLAASVRDGLSVPALARAVLQVVSAITYAHGRGVVHGDLSPANVLVGPHGEVHVLDWGRGPAAGHRGTPGYAAPEVLGGGGGTQAADAYALGALVTLVVRGRGPFAHPDPDVVVAWQLGGNRASFDGPDDRVVPQREVLVEVARRCLDTDPSARPSVAEVGDALTAWLDGSRAHDEASEMVGEARAWLDRAADHGRVARTKDAAARRLLAGVRPSAPAAERDEAWALQDEGAHAARAMALAEARAESLLHAALQRSSGHAGAARALGQLRRARLEGAEARNDVQAAAVLTQLIELDGPAPQRAWLGAPGRLVLRTMEDGWPVRVERFRRDRRYWTVETVAEAHTPLTIVVPPGSYRLVVDGPGGVFHFVAWVRRGETCELGNVALPRSIPSGTVWIPSGVLTTGGDVDAVDPLVPGRHRIGAFFLQRDPVTWRAYGAWLRTLDDPSPFVPRDGEGRAMWRDGAVVDFGDGVPVSRDAPVSFVDHRMAEAFAAHRAATEGLAWRLPHELEWEWAAAGADGRHFPWGHHFEPSWTSMMDSHDGPPRRCPVEDLAEDLSPFGVRGLAGNVRDWCANGYRSGGPVTDGVLDPTEPSGDRTYAVQRGGNWTSSATFCRVASRFGTKRERRLAGTGFRLALSTNHGP